ncbi:MAG: 4-(cytidine 5'-diphospho)-2-C-methyl-D-erythritol kinase [Acidobacteria bacterium]|nr:4-(cytidine 5'-diphospho)-2-C-methyl-D-erythritol kinase [Acidobacteriota bacterium]
MTGRRSPGRLRVRAPAKINLDLRVLRRRPDGYHEVSTILQSIALHDTLTIAPRHGPLTVRSAAPEVPADRGNLVWTAAAALWRAAGRPGDPDGVGVSIRKRVPAAAGLGGASSDAASALRALRRWWAPSASARWLEGVAADVGSDVPFFLRGGTVLATGRGERMRRLRPPEGYWVVLAAPGFGVSTADAYRWWDLDAPEAAAGPRGKAGAPGGWRRDLGRLRNDLEAPVGRRHAEIGALAARLRAAGALRAALTGSGSVVFGLFASRARALEARRALRAIVAAPGGVLLTRTIDAVACARLAAVARID